MSLRRGIKSISHGYVRDFTPVPETEESICTCISFETDDDEYCDVKQVGTPPDSVTLNARMIPTKITVKTFAEKFVNGTSLGKNPIYSSPIFSENSTLKDFSTFCEKITLKFENSGDYSFGNRKNIFFGKSFEEYEVVFPGTSDVLFEKNFLLSTSPVIEQFSVSAARSASSSEEGGTEPSVCRIYPYAGFFGYGAHPKEVESCVFQIGSTPSSGGAIRVWKLNKFFEKYGVDPTRDGTPKSGTKFAGVKNFSPSQKITLYEELLNGASEIVLKNIFEGAEKIPYVSRGVYHIPNTDLISINFVRK
jgi:hypothetical protein